MDRGAWRARVHGVTKSRTWLSEHTQAWVFNNHLRKREPLICGDYPATVVYRPRRCLVLEVGPCLTVSWAEGPWVATPDLHGQAVLPSLLKNWSQRQPRQGHEPSKVEGVDWVKFLPLKKVPRLGDANEALLLRLDGGDMGTHFLFVS